MLELHPQTALIFKAHWVQFFELLSTYNILMNEERPFLKFWDYESDVISLQVTILFGISYSCLHFKEFLLLPWFHSPVYIPWIVHSGNQAEQPACFLYWREAKAQRRWC